MSATARPIYESDLPWDPERPDTVLITCVDGRWYRARTIGPSTVDFKDRQIADLRSSASRLREMFEGVVVETYFARLSGSNPETVVFETV